MVQHTDIKTGDAALVKTEFSGNAILENYDPKANKRISRKNMRQKHLGSPTKFTALDAAKEEAAKKLANAYDYKSMPSEDEYIKAVLEEAKPQLEALRNGIISAMNHADDTRTFEVKFTDENLLKTAFLIDSLNPFRISDLKKKPAAYENFCAEALEIVSNNNLKNHNRTASQALDKFLGADNSQAREVQATGRPTIPKTLAEEDNTKSHELSFPIMKAQAQKRQDIKGPKSKIPSFLQKGGQKTASKPLVTRAEGKDDPEKQTTIVLSAKEIPTIPSLEGISFTLDKNALGSPQLMHVVEDPSTGCDEFAFFDRGIKPVEDDAKPSHATTYEKKPNAEPYVLPSAMRVLSVKQKAMSSSIWTRLKESAANTPRFAKAAAVTAVAIFAAVAAPTGLNNNAPSSDAQVTTAATDWIVSPPQFGEPDKAASAQDKAPTESAHTSSDEAPTVMASLPKQNLAAQAYETLDQFHANSSSIMPDYAAAPTVLETPSAPDYAALEQFHANVAQPMPDYDAAPTTIKQQSVVEAPATEKTLQFPSLDKNESVTGNDNFSINARIAGAFENFADDNSAMSFFNSAANEGAYALSEAEVTFTKDNEEEQIRTFYEAHNKSVPASMERLFRDMQWGENNDIAGHKEMRIHEAGAKMLQSFGSQGDAGAFVKTMYESIINNTPAHYEAHRVARLDLEKWDNVVLAYEKIGEPVTASYQHTEPQLPMLAMR